MATFDVACSRNGNASCINVNVDVPTVAAALMVSNAVNMCVYTYIYVLPKCTTTM